MIKWAGLNLEQLSRGGDDPLLDMQGLSFGLISCSRKLFKYGIDPPEFENKAVGE
jgi:hypothetical protein